MTNPQATCEDLLRDLWAYVDQELPAEHHAPLDAHLRSCGHCFHAVDFERAFLAALQSARHEPAVRDALRERLTSLVRQHAGDPPDAAGDIVP